MSRYIDVERLCEIAEHSQSYNSIVLAAGMCPIVDAVEVVRCKDCKHWRELQGYSRTYYECDLFTYNDDENGFCHYAERKEE